MCNTIQTTYRACRQHVVFRKCVGYTFPIQGDNILHNTRSHCKKLCQHHAHVYTDIHG